MPDYKPTHCNTIKRDGFWCAKPAVTVVNGKGYCTRHRSHADGKAYAPVADKRSQGR